MPLHNKEKGCCMGNSFGLNRIHKTGKVEEVVGLKVIFTPLLTKKKLCDKSQRIFRKRLGEIEMNSKA